MRSRDGRVFAVLLCLLPVLTVYAAGSASVHSPSRHFLVIAPDDGQAISVARWADDVAERLERATRRKMDFSSRDFQIRLQAGALESSGCNLRREGVLGEKFVQELLIDGFDDADWEDVLEVYCDMLLGGQAVVENLAGRREGSQQVVVSVPAWLSVGLSHCIDPALKSRDRRMILNGKKRGKTPLLGDVLKWKVLPPGRSREKAACTMAVSWLMSFPNSGNRFALISDRLGAGEALTGEWMAAQIPGCESMDNAELLWVKRIEAERNTVPEPGVIFPDALEFLRDELAIRPGECGLPTDPSLPPTLKLRTLIEMKSLDWIPLFCRAKAVAIRMSVINGSAEARKVADAYCGFLRLLGERGSDARLLALLTRADDMLRNLENVTWKRTAHMDAMEQKYGSAEVDSGDEGTAAKAELAR